MEAEELKARYEMVIHERKKLMEVKDLEMDKVSTVIPPPVQLVLYSSLHLLGCTKCL